MIEVPIAAIPPRGYVQRGFRRDLPVTHARVLLGITAALKADRAKLATGSLVRDADDAVLWLLEQAERAARNTP